MFNIFKKDNFGLIVVLFLSVVCIYLVPILKTPFFLATLFLFYFSERDHLWICFLFIFLQNPGFLFLYRQGWIFELTRTVGIPYELAFALVALVKVIPRLKRSKYSFFSKAPLLIAFYVAFLFAISLAIGINTKSVYIFILYVTAQTLFISVPMLLRDGESFRNFTRIAYFAMLLLAIIQIVDTLLPVKLFQILGVRFSADEMLNLGSNYMMDLRNSTEAVRVLYGPQLSLFCLATALYYMIDKKQSFFTRNTLSIVIIVSLTSVFMTATRGWIIAYGFLLLVMVPMANIGTTKTIVTGAFILALILVVSPLLRKQTTLVLQRVATVNEYLEGDKTAGGTMQRLTVRAPRVYNKFKESPTIGFGYSIQGIEYNDGHVGNYNILLEGGWVGALVYILVLMMVILKVFTGVSYGLMSYKQFLVLLSILGVMIIIHSSSAQFFGYLIYDERNLLIVLLLLFISRAVFQVSADKDVQNAIRNSY